jgi:hypothetical protein
MSAPPAAPVFEPPLELTCFEYVRPMSGGITQPLLVGACLPSGQRLRAVLKFRHPGTRRGQGHFGATSLACELICAALARALGLNTPDYAIAHVGSIFAHSIRDEAVRDRLCQNLGPNFATILIEPLPMPWKPGCTRRSFELREAMEQVLSFDATIMNGDRRQEHPNLLWDGADTLHVIDHGLACLVAHAQDAALISAGPLLPDWIVKGHCGYSFLRGNGCTFETVHARWGSRIGAAFWAALRAAIPAEWEDHPGELDRIFEFLVARSMRFVDVNLALRRVVQ